MEVSGRPGNFFVSGNERSHLRSSGRAGTGSLVLQSRCCQFSGSFNRPGEVEITVSLLCDDPEQDGQPHRVFRPTTYARSNGSGYSVKADIRDELCQLNKDSPDGQAVPGTLEHFLAERYIMYINDPASGLYRGRVHHKPYPLCEAQLLNIQESLLESNRLFTESDVRHVVFSEGVDVEVFRFIRLMRSLVSK